jgi:hypothetical protein
MEIEWKIYIYCVEAMLSFNSELINYIISHEIRYMDNCQKGCENEHQS